MYPLHIAEGLGQEGLPLGQRLLDCRPSRALGWIPGHRAVGSVQDCWSDPQDTGWLGSSVPGGRVTALFLRGGWAGAGPVPREQLHWVRGSSPSCHLWVSGRKPGRHSGPYLSWVPLSLPSLWPRTAGLLPPEPGRLPLCRRPALIGPRSASQAA